MAGATWGGRARGLAAFAAAVLGIAALGALVAAAARAAPSEFPHLRKNLSASVPMSAYPDLAVSVPDRDRVVVAWTEEHGALLYQGDVYLRAASESGAGWDSKVRVYDGDDDACAYGKASVAVTGTTAHVAYVVYYDDCSDPAFTQVRYSKCNLATRQCDPSEVVAQAVSSLLYYIPQVDLAVDGSGNPHVVWTRYFEGQNNGVVQYRARTGAGWGTVDDVASGVGENHHSPAIACYGGYAHVAWQGPEGTYGNQAVLYWRHPISTGTELWHTLYYTLVQSSPSVNRPYAPHDPDVAAWGGRVFVVWNLDYDDEWPGTYALVYRLSSNDGATFGYPAEVGVDLSIDEEKEWHYLTPYDPLLATPFENLWPSGALGSGGEQAVVWHTSTDGDPHAIYYSYVLSGTEWFTPTVLRQGQVGSPAVGMGGWITESIPLLHVAYMEEGSSWDVYYDSNQEYTFDAPDVYVPLVLRAFQ